MQDFFKQILDTVAEGVRGEGEKYVKSKAISALEALIGVARRLLLLQYVLMSICFLWAGSFLATGTILSGNWNLVRELEAPPGLPFALGTLIVTTLFLAVTVQQRLWVKFVGLEKLKNPPRSRAEVSQESDGAFSEARLAAMIEKAVSAQVRAAMRETVPAPADPASRDQSERPTPSA